LRSQKGKSEISNAVVVSSLVKPQGAPVQQRSAKRFRPSPLLAIVVGASAISLGISFWQLTVPKYVGLYDSGVYLAASIHFVSGALPYKDFDFVQPPGILILMSPAAIFSRLVGSHDGLEFARVITSFVSALNVGMLAWLVRYRGRTAMLIAGLGLALIPLASEMSSALFLEQYVVFFVLLGSLAIFSSEPLIGRLSIRAVAFGGALFGFAALVKIWAFFPFAAMAITLALLHRKRVAAFVLSATSTFVVFSLPFLLGAPGNFFRQVFVDQLTRRSYWGDDAGSLSRLIAMTGFALTRIPPTAEEAVIIFVVFLCIVAFAYTSRVAVGGVEVFLLFAAVVTTLGLLSAPIFFPHYAALALPPLLGLVAISLTRLSGPVRMVVDGLKISNLVRRLVAWTLGLIVVIFVTSMIIWDASFYRDVAAQEVSNSATLSEIPRYIPAGSCVIYDDVGYGVVENRLLSSDPKCPIMIDPIGIRLGRGNETTRPTSAFIAQWKSYFEEAQFVVRDGPAFSTIPVDHALRSWFTTHYRLLYNGDFLQIYEHDPKT
jgi:alpha-1,2-mannosyltransferase